MALASGGTAVAAVVIAAAAGPAVRRSWPGMGLGAFPFAGGWGWPAAGWWAAVAVLGAVAVAIGTAAAATRLPFPVLLAGSGPAAAAWAGALALVDGPAGLRGSLASRFDYLAVVPLRSPSRFVATFVDRVPELPTHVKAHPPGLPVLLDALHRAGLRGVGWTAALCLAAGASAAPAVVLTVDRLAGRSWARAALPFAVASPFALWWATSADAVFLAVGSWCVAAAVLAATSRRPGPAWGWGLACGALAGIGVLLSYGLAPVVGLALAGLAGAALVGAARRGPAVVAVAVAVLAVVAAGLAGFWWWDGLRATRAAYHAGIAADRPYRLLFVANIVVAVAAVGPAAVAGLATLAHRRLWMVTGGAVVVVLASNASGLSKGEVERIWLPFYPWVVLAAASLGARRARGRWLGAQVAATVALALALRSPW